MRSDKQFKRIEAIHSHPSPPNVHKAHLMVTEQYTSVSGEVNEILHPLREMSASPMDLKLYFYNAKIAFQQPRNSFLQVADLNTTLHHTLVFQP